MFWWGRDWVGVFSSFPPVSQGVCAWSPHLEPTSCESFRSVPFRIRSRARLDSGIPYSLSPGGAVVLYVRVYGFSTWLRFFQCATGEFVFLSRTRTGTASSGHQQPAVYRDLDDQTLDTFGSRRPSTGTPSLHSRNRCVCFWAFRSLRVHVCLSCMRVCGRFPPSLALFPTSPSSHLPSPGPSRAPLFLPSSRAHARAPGRSLTHSLTHPHAHNAQALLSGATDHDHAGLPATSVPSPTAAKFSCAPLKLCIRPLPVH